MQRVPADDKHRSGSTPDQPIDNIDAGFRFGISRDGFMAYLTLLRPRSGSGRTLTTEVVERVLAQHKVVYGISRERIDTLVAGLNRGSVAGVTPDVGQPTDPADQRFYAVALGDIVEDGRDGRLQWLRKPAGPEWRVGPGETLARYLPVKAGKPGIDVLGRMVAPQPGVDCAPRLGPGVEAHAEDATQAYRARWLGQVTWDEETLDVAAGITVSDDGLSSALPLFAQTSAGAPVTLEGVKASLGALGIVFGVDDAAIQEGLTRAAAAAPGTPLEGIGVARGDPPGDPQHAALNVRYEGQQIGQELDRGRINFRERNYPWNVTAGEMLGQFFEARPGLPGRSVRGDDIPSSEPRCLNLTLVGIHREADGNLVAERDGALLIEGQKLEITDLFTVNGDVGPKTGNIRTHAAVHVRGYVLAGFAVESGRAVIVDDNVESATVRAEGEVVIKAGIRGPDCHLWVRGGLTAGFLENTDIVVSGDMIVHRGIMNSSVSCDGSLYVGDPRGPSGAIIASRIHAHLAMETVTLGSPNYARTQITVGVSETERGELQTVRAAIAEKHLDIERLVQLEQRYLREPAKLSQLLPKIKMTRETLFGEMGELKDVEQRLLGEIQASKDAQIIVRRIVYPGVTVAINQFFFEVREELGPGRFFLGEAGVAYQQGVFR